jgi:4-hydroxy-2-oxoglutarate aldolase
VPLRGVVPPLVTPFRSDGSLDLPAFEANLDSLGDSGLAGLLVLGSNGEAASLEESEKLELMATARRSAPGRFLLAGTGTESTRGTVALTRRAADAGADAALVLTPHFYRGRMSAEALQRHYETVAEASPVPVFLYSVPAFTGLSWPPGLASSLAGHPRITGMKESSGDIGLLQRILSEVPPSFELLCGNAPVLYAALCVGATGGIVAVANCVPRVVVALYQAFADGDHTRACELQNVLTPLAVAVTSTWGVAGLKTAMDLAGLRGGEVRAPLLPVPEAARDEIRPLLERARAAVA